MIIFTGTITTKQPISIVLPESESYLNAPKCASIPMYFQGERVDTVCIPGTTIRGTLRRNAYDITHPGTQSLERIYNSLIGQDRVSEVAGDGKINLVKLKEGRDADPVVNLFGAGLTYAGRLEVGIATSQTPVKPTLVRGVRKDIDPLSRVFAAMSKEDQEIWEKRNNAVPECTRIKKQITGLKGMLVKNARETKKELKKLDQDSFALDKLSNEVISLNEQIELLEKELKSYDEVTKGRKNNTNHITGYWAMPQGVTLNHQIRLRDKSLLPLLLDSINSLSLNPVLGGQVARGCGEIEATWNVKEVVDGSVTELGTVSIGGFQPAVVSGDLNV